jgi:insecticidal toxin complex protein TccC
VLKVRNDAEATRFWRNQKVVPENTYAYDSLYQLTSATGREMANAGQRPAAADRPPSWRQHRVHELHPHLHLRQRRQPDADKPQSAGHEQQLHHPYHRLRPEQPGVLSALTENPADVEAFFTAGGQQALLQPGLTLTWTPRSELLTVTLVVREGQPSDQESYRYDADSQRLLKVSRQLTGGSTQTKRALYLPGLEHRTTVSGEAETESLQVITVGGPGAGAGAALGERQAG